MGNVMQYYRALNRGAAGDRSLAPGLDTDYVAVYNYAVTQGFLTPFQSEQIRDSQRIVNLKTESCWSELDLLYFFDQSQGCEDFAKLNFKNSASFQVSSPAMPGFVDDLGFETDGNTYLNTNWNMLNDRVKAQSLDVSIICKAFYQGSAISIGTICGARSGNNNGQFFIWKIATNSASARLQLNTITTNPFADFFGNNCLFVRTLSGKRDYANGVLSTSSTHAAPLDFPNFPMTLFALNNAGTISTPGTLIPFGLKYWGIGSSFLESKALEISQIMDGTYV